MAIGSALYDVEYDDPDGGGVGHPVQDRLYADQFCDLLIRAVAEIDRNEVILRARIGIIRSAWRCSLRRPGRANPLDPSA